MKMALLVIDVQQGLCEGENDAFESQQIGPIRLRRAQHQDGPPVGHIHATSFRTYLPTVPQLHDDADIERYFSGLVDTQECWIAEQDGAVIGFCVLRVDDVHRHPTDPNVHGHPDVEGHPDVRGHPDGTRGPNTSGAADALDATGADGAIPDGDVRWLDHLYLAPGKTGRGAGSQLVRLAKERRPGGLQLWTFQVNVGARRFYERHGFTASEFTDGAGNEEHTPDVRYVWRPTP